MMTKKFYEAALNVGAALIIWGGILSCLFLTHDILLFTVGLFNLIVGATVMMCAEITKPCETYMVEHLKREDVYSFQSEEDAVRAIKRWLAEEEEVA